MIGSGRYGKTVAMAETANALSGRVALLTCFPESRIGNLADTVVRIPAPTPKVESGTGPVQPMGHCSNRACRSCWTSRHAAHGMESDGLHAHVRAEREPRMPVWLSINHRNRCARGQYRFGHGRSVEPDISIIGSRSRAMR